MVYGSDLLGGMHLHQNAEFRLRSEVQPVIDIIRSATTTAAELLGLPGTLGILAPGAMADLIVLDSDPLTDVGVLADIGQHLEMVIQGGVVIDRGALGSDPHAPR
jgi:imidazolonepropionase-like amidohydrolase